VSNAGAPEAGNRLQQGFLVAFVNGLVLDQVVGGVMRGERAGVGLQELKPTSQELLEAANAVVPIDSAAVELAR
jgi:hypothetical protein